MSVSLELIKEYNNKRNIKEYLMGIKTNLGNDVRIVEILSKLDMELIVIENKISNNITEQ